MSKQYVAMSVTSLSPIESQDRFEVFEVVNGIMVLVKGVLRTSLR
jgi:hypothetical protein